jgi:hypothetical protein
MGNKFDHTRDYNDRYATQAEEEIRMYKLGTPVEIVSVDMHGLQGRDPHPPKHAAGRIGTIVSDPMHEYDADDDEPVITYYTIMIPGLGTFDFADYEVN